MHLTNRPSCALPPNHAYEMSEAPGHIGGERARWGKRVLRENQMWVK